MVWLWTTYKGADKGGYPVFIEDILPARLQKYICTKDDADHAETEPKIQKSR